MIIYCLEPQSVTAHNKLFFSTKKTKKRPPSGRNMLTGYVPIYAIGNRV